MRIPKIFNTLGMPTHERPEPRRVDGRSVRDESPVADAITGEALAATNREDPRHVTIVKTQATAPLIKTGNPVLLVPDKQAYQRVRIYTTVAGVEVSFQPNFNTGTGQGMPVPTNEWTELTMSPGDRMYVGTTTNATISLIVEGLPWHEKVTTGLATR